jgi:hypothetical protein
MNFGNWLLIAAESMTTMTEVEPQPRIDTLVRLPEGGEARRGDPDAELLDVVLPPGQPAV